MPKTCYEVLVSSWLVMSFMLVNKVVNEICNLIGVGINSNLS